MQVHALGMLKWEGLNQTCLPEEENEGAALPSCLHSPPQLPTIATLQLHQQLGVPWAGSCSSSLASPLAALLQLRRRS